MLISVINSLDLKAKDCLEYISVMWQAWQVKQYKILGASENTHCFWAHDKGNLLLLNLPLKKVSFYAKFI